MTQTFWCPLKSDGFHAVRNLNGGMWWSVRLRWGKDFQAEQFVLPGSQPWPWWLSCCCGLNLFNCWSTRDVLLLTQAGTRRNVDVHLNRREIYTNRYNSLDLTAPSVETEGNWRKRAQKSSMSKDGKEAVFVFTSEWCVRIGVGGGGRRVNSRLGRHRVKTERAAERI